MCNAETWSQNTVLAMSSPFHIDHAIFREEISEACRVTDTIGDPGKVADALVTYSQAKALDYRTPLVRGGRGSGKSFWWAALQREGHRRWIAESLGAKMAAVDNLEVIPGFGVASSDSYPSSRVLVALAAENAEHMEDIWLTVVLFQLLPEGDSPFGGLATWKERVAWTSGHVEAAARMMRQVAGEFDRKNGHLLVVFDGLDRLASTWDKVRPLAQSILRFVLQLHAYPRLRGKIFLRPDMFDDPGISAFPDASKLKDNHARLDWNPVELFALFFQRLANANEEEVAGAFRDGVVQILTDFGLRRIAWEKKTGVWSLPAPLRSDPSAQREVFHMIAGRAMSHNQNSVKRGFPYTWLPNHLADSHGEISPRSFLAALRESAQFNPPLDSPLALYFTGIQKGVSAASSTRVEEISEDFPWVRELMLPLNGAINVPCDEQDLFRIWRDDNVVEKLQNMPSDEASPKVGPTSLGARPLEGLLENLIRLGIFSKQKESRIQMPDVYRVAFGIGRKGGIPPIRQTVK